ncbi:MULTISPECIES: TetR/AcrR family transcriptional regulator [unclassified Sinorhizobium]|uniref:TetR/AcrR family transcriptional regulator n=1 Tax=unclassified Sinorhizobium TaxID=2613772 RepID=UPI003523F918
MPRLTRTESQALTRERLLDAGRRIFLQEGYVRASVDKVAEDAGYSKGAIYSNFASKEALFIALLKQKFESDLTGLRDLLQNVSDPEELLVSLRRHYTNHVEVLDITLVAAEFLTQVGRGSPYVQECNALYAQQRQAMAELIAALFERSGRSLPGAPVDLATALIGLSMGLALQRGVDPDAVTPGKWGQAIEQHLRGLLALG